MTTTTTTEGYSPPWLLFAGRRVSLQRREGDKSGVELLQDVDPNRHSVAGVELVEPPQPRE